MNDHHMSCSQRLKVITILNRLFTQYEDQYDLIMKQMENESIVIDFFEDLYDMLYDFDYHEMRLLARVMKLLEQKSSDLSDKNTENWYN